MSKYWASDFRIEVQTGNNRSFANVGEAMGMHGMASEIRIWPSICQYYLCTRRDTPLCAQVILVPSIEFKAELERSGYQIIEDLTERLKVKTV